MTTPPISAFHIGILGGTFDPIHLAHLRLAVEAREQLVLDQVLFVPAPQPWRKAGKPITPVYQRLELVRLALAGDSTLALSTVELRREGPTYTAETLTALRADLGPSVTLHFILGADALVDLPNWYRPDLIVAQARLAVAARPRARLPDIAALDARIPGIAAAIEPIAMPRLDVSSTDIRQRVTDGRSIRYLVPDTVAAYIDLHRLYRA